MYYQNTLVTFTEVPDEISLCFNLYGCPFHCHNCFEPWLQERRPQSNAGFVFDMSAITKELEEHPHCTCICFMGGDGDPITLYTIIDKLRKTYPVMKFAMYSGDTKMNPLLETCLDYYKLGPFIEELGPLNSTTTNQRMYKKINNEWTDITYRFQIKKN